LRASAPVREQALPGAASPIRVELGGPGEASVRLEVVRMGGDIRVSVNAGDAGLASVLQQGLPELQQRFDHTGVDAMIRLPDETGAILATEKSGNQNSSSESPAHSQGDDARWPGGDRNGQQRQNRQTKHWFQQWMMED
jgi:hypothetical protein